MSAETVQANYQSLEETVKGFSTLQQTAEEIKRRVKSRMDPLINGGWEGEGKKEFEEEMTQVIMPRLDRMIDALGAISSTVTSISSTMREAENQAKNLMNQD